MKNKTLPSSHVISLLDKNKLITGKSGKIASMKKVSTASMVFNNNLIKTSRIRHIGNSKGVILNNQLIKAAGLNPEVDIFIEAQVGVIAITQAKMLKVNTDLSTWDKHFKQAIKKSRKTDTDLFEGMNNEFDTKEW